MRENSQRWAVGAALALLAVAIAVTPITNNDIWLHLKTGSLILERGSVPRVEEYTFTRAGVPLVDHEWLAQVVFALVHRLGGVPALTALGLALVLGTIALVYRGAMGAARATDRAAATLVTAGAALLIATHFDIRPHLFTFLLAAAYALILPATGAEDRRARWRALAGIVLLQILWANLHGAFVVGILLALLHVIDRAAATRRLPPGSSLPIFLAAASCVNPYGWKIYRLVGTFADPAFRQFIVEWQSPFTRPFVLSPLFGLYALWVAAIAALGVRALRRGAGARALPALILAALSLTSRRHVSLLGVVAASFLTAELAGLLSRRPGGARESAGWARRAAGTLPFAAAGAVVALASGIALAGLPLGGGVWRPAGVGIAPNIPVEALEVMRRERLEGRVFPAFGFGAYVTWAGWPAMRTFVDSRLEIFGGDFLRAYDALRRPAEFRRAMEATPFDIALLSWQADPVAAAVTVLSQDPGWALVYFDDTAILYVKRIPGRESLVERRAYRAIDPFRLFAGGGAPGGPKEAEIEARRAVADPPPLPGRPAMNGRARVVLAAALQQQGRHAEAVRELRAALEARPDAAIAWGMLGTSLLETGDREGARAAFQELKRRMPGSAFADQMLSEIDRGGSSPPPPG